MRFECELISEKFLPAARTVVAEILSEKYGHEQYEIADQLGVTQPAVSQYLGGKRADQDLISKLKDDPQTRVLLEEAASQAARNENYEEEFSEVLRVSKAKGFFSHDFNEAGSIL